MRVCAVCSLLWPSVAGIHAVRMTDTDTTATFSQDPEGSQALRMAGTDTSAPVNEDTSHVNKDVEAKPQEPPNKKNTREEKSRKKDDKSVEQVLKALNSLETTEEKLAAMCKKYADIVDENRKLQLSVKQTEKRMVVLQREKEQMQAEHSKAVLTRSRLENLCRELQRQNKAVKEESLLKIREEEEKRKEVSAKFQSTLADVTALMQQNNEKNLKLREDNLEMAEKFKSMCEQYELREQQVDKISKQLKLEIQLADAKTTETKMEMAAEKGKLLREKQQLLLEVTECQAKIQDLQTTEANLRSQISLYTNKYDEFQNALSRSNDVFEGFKGEMERMSKKICKLEKETSSWKQRWEKSHQALLEMAADKQQRDGELALSQRQLAQLQKLCRTLQAERTSLLAQLRLSGNAPGLTNGTASEGCSVDGQEAAVDSPVEAKGQADTSVITCEDHKVTSATSEAKADDVVPSMAGKADTVEPEDSMVAKEDATLTPATDGPSGSNIIIPAEVNGKCQNELPQDSAPQVPDASAVCPESPGPSEVHTPENPASPSKEKKNTKDAVKKRKK